MNIFNLIKNELTNYLLNSCESYIKSINNQKALDWITEQRDDIFLINPFRQKLIHSNNIYRQLESTIEFNCEGLILHLRQKESLDIVLDDESQELVNGLIDSFRTCLLDFESTNPTFKIDNKRFVNQYRFFGIKLDISLSIPFISSELEIYNFNNVSSTIEHTPLIEKHFNDFVYKFNPNDFKEYPGTVGNLKLNGLKIKNTELLDAYNDLRSIASFLLNKRAGKRYHKGDYITNRLKCLMDGTADYEQIMMIESNRLTYNCIITGFGTVCGHNCYDFELRLKSFFEEKYKDIPGFEFRVLEEYGERKWR